MTTKIITPQEVTLDMLRAGVESNMTKYNLPSRFKLQGDKVDYFVKFNPWSKVADGWDYIESFTVEEIERYMKDDSSDDTVWTTPIVETA